MWPLQNPAMPAEVSFRAFSPTTPDALEVFPTRACSYNPALLGMFPSGLCHRAARRRRAEAAEACAGSVRERAF